MKILQDAGYSCDGIDVAERAIAFGKEKLGLSTIECMDVADLYKLDKKYNAVLAIDILEHLADPVYFLTAVSQVLEDKGLLVVEFPTVSSLSFKMLGEFWYWVMSPYHLYYYSIKAISTLLAKSGFLIIGCEGIAQSWMWAEAIANSLGTLMKYHQWRQDTDFVKFTIEIDRMFDQVALHIGEPSALSIYARKVANN